MNSKMFNLIKTSTNKNASEWELGYYIPTESDVTDVIQVTLSYKFKIMRPEL